MCRLQLVFDAISESEKCHCHQLLTTISPNFFRRLEKVKELGSYHKWKVLNQFNGWADTEPSMNTKLFTISKH